MRPPERCGDRVVEDRGGPRSSGGDSCRLAIELQGGRFAQLAGIY